MPNKNKALIIRGTYEVPETLILSIQKVFQIESVSHSENLLNSPVLILK